MNFIMKFQISNFFNFKLIYYEFFKYWILIIYSLQALSLLGYTQMTPVQASTIPAFLNSKDVIVEVNSNF